MKLLFFKSISPLLVVSFFMLQGNEQNQQIISKEIQFLVNHAIDIDYIAPIDLMQKQHLSKSISETVSSSPFFPTFLVYYNKERIIFSEHDREDFKNATQRLLPLIKKAIDKYSIDDPNGYNDLDCGYLSLAFEQF